MWTTGIQKLRVILSDGPTDRYNFRKRCFGEINEINTRFKTFDFRRITDFSVQQGIFLDGVLQAVSAVSSDSPLTGEFILASAPADGSVLEASYYTQWFLDAELNEFLNDGVLWLQSGSDYTQVPNGLIPAVEKYAISEAYLKMAIRWKTYMSQTFKVEDAPKEGADGKTNDFIELAKVYRDDALKIRKEFFKRQDRNLQPLFANVIGTVKNIP